MRLVDQCMTVDDLRTLGSTVTIAHRHQKITDEDYAAFDARYVARFRRLDAGAVHYDAAGHALDAQGRVL